MSELSRSADAGWVRLVTPVALPLVLASDRCLLDWLESLRVQMPPRKHMVLYAVRNDTVRVRNFQIVAAFHACFGRFPECREQHLMEAYLRVEHEHRQRTLPKPTTRKIRLPGEPLKTAGLAESLHSPLLDYSLEAA